MDDIRVMRTLGQGSLTLNSERAVEALRDDKRQGESYGSHPAVTKSLWEVYTQIWRPP